MSSQATKAINLNAELFGPYERLIVMVSGGSDSVALLRLLLELQQATDLSAQITVFHFNHQLRAAQSDADEQFVRGLCSDLGVECEVGTVDVSQYAKQHKLSIEAAARALRYSAVCEYVQTANWGQTPAIVTAHTADDQTETFFMRAITGAGSGALGGMRPASIAIDTAADNSDGAAIDAIARTTSPALDSGRGRTRQSIESLTLLRPLINCDKVDLQTYLKSISQPWREDATNYDNSSTRSAIRNQLIPVMKELNPSLNRTISKTCTILRDEASFITDYSRKLLEQYTIAVNIEADCTAAFLFQQSFYTDLPNAVRREVAKLALEEIGLLNSDLCFVIVEKVADKAEYSEPAYTLTHDLTLCIHGQWMLLVNTDMLIKEWSQISNLLKQATGVNELPTCLQKLRRNSYGRQ